MPTCTILVCALPNGREIASIICGKVEDIVGALTPVGRGVAQVFHDLLIELRLLLVAELEERGVKEGQEESWEVERGDQREERTLTWMAMQME